MEVKLNGVTMNGTPEQIAAIARQLGVEVGNDGVYYLSSSRGLIRITDMQDEHLKRTIAKRTRDWAVNLSNLDGAAFIREVTNGTRDVTTLAMVREYTSRVARGSTINVLTRR